MGAIVEILQGLNLLVSFIVPTVETALKIKSHFELDPSMTVNVTTLEGDAITADETTIANINTWRASVGLAALPLPTPIPDTPQS